ncbi:MAG: prolyl oligopeptidase family serine peptidase [Lachnospiraceae bacterium]|nr:prolyl oligopeptidase family serine peptidase [Lachnospiraceae bacterium]
MKKRRKGLWVAAALVVLFGVGFWYLFLGSRITDASDEVTPGEADTRSLVVYFSRAGELEGTVDAVSSATQNSNQDMDGSDTEAAAKMIQELTGADIYQIHTARYYRNAFLGTAATAWIEETFNLRPALAAWPESLDDYDVIYVGYPIWWFNAPMTVGSFLETYDLTGKIIVPFCTSSDNGIDVSMDYIREVSEGATVLDGYRIHNATIEDVSAWLTRIGMLGQAETTEEPEDKQVENEQTEDEQSADEQPEESSLGYVTEGTGEYRGFVTDNVFHSVTEGDIHYNVYIPESYDGSEPYAIYFTLPGYEGLYFQGIATNLQYEEYGFEAQKYIPEMIIVAPQLYDWGETSAAQTIALVEYFLETYDIDPSRVYASGLSGGGETMSLAAGMRPDLFTAYLQISSQWDGEYETVAEARLPVYLVIGRDDEYYGSASSQEAYDTLHQLYEEQGMTEEEIDQILVLDIKEHDYFTDQDVSNEHAGALLFAYDEEIMDWLFSW